MIYFYRPRAGRIYLITAYAKNERADLTMAQRRDLRRLTGLLEAEDQ